MDSQTTIMYELDNIQIAQSNVHTINDFSRQTTIQKSDFTIISQNIRSIYNNFDDLLITLSEFKFQADVITLTEGWIDPHKPIPQMDNYTHFVTSRHLNRSDGVVVYIKCNHKTIVQEINLKHASCLQVKVVNLGAFASGVCVAWTSSALPLMISGQYETQTARSSDVFTSNNGTHTKIMLTETEASWVASLLCLGALFGAVPSGLISEYFGRKKTLLYLALPLVVSWILVASSPNVYGLYVGRFVSGVAVGAFSVAIPPYIEDIAETNILPALANFYHVHFAAGVLFGYIIGLVQSASWLSVLCASIPISFFIGFIFLPESPAYLMSQGKFPEAKAALQYFRGIDNDVDSEMKELKEYVRNYGRNKVTFRQLFTSRTTIKPLIVSFGLMIFQQMSGIYPILFYAEKIFKNFAISLNLPSATIILGLCFVTSMYFSTMFLKKFRRRVLLLISFTLMALSLGTLAMFYNLKASNLSAHNTWVPLSTLCIFVSVYAVGAGPIPWLMLREIFAPNVRRRATALTAGFHWFFAFGVTKLYQNLIHLVSPGWTLWHFAVTSLIGTIFVYFFVPETKGRTLEEIHNEFDGIHKRKRHRHVIEVETVSVQ